MTGEIRFYQSNCTSGWYSLTGSVSEDLTVLTLNFNSGCGQGSVTLTKKGERWRGPFNLSEYNGDFSLK